MDKSRYGVHRTHCCVKHGCKYKNELSKLSLIEQYKFISQCEKILFDINNSFNKFMEMYRNK